ncbi:Crp/Fnr family transcriptional regulator [Myroides odoratus]|uniref:Crp/Fnr family transcriptional regulator n=1 Tax=Myroides odoratus TaxID=256 RepID=UPI000766038D|nr:Crp/Fnr family transcriptional regulator [Myroides odoratus]
MDVNPIEVLIQHLQQTIALNEKEIQRISEVAEIVLLKRKELLLQPGQLSQHMRFIAQGSARCYYLDENTQEHTLQIGIEEWWINDLYSFLTQKESKLFIQSIEPATIVQISRENLEQLYAEIPAISTFFRLKIQSAYVALQERTIEHMSADVFTRYQRFIKEYRNIEQRVPQYMIASYLGVTPEFLSYLKKKQHEK